MHILGFILIVSGLLVATYFSEPKSNSEQNNQPQPAQGQIETLPIKQADSSNYDYEKAKAAGLSDEEIQNYIATKSPNGTVTIRNKATGEIRKIPKSQLANYISSSKPQPKVVKASDKALKLSIYAFLASNEKQRKDLINKFSNGTNDLKEAINNLALQLDGNPEATTLAEKLVAQDIANKKSQSDSQAVIEYHEKEYARLKAEVDNLPSSTSYTYTDRTKNTAIAPTKTGSTQVNTFQGNTQEINNRLKNMLDSSNTYSENIFNSPNTPNLNTYKAPIRYDAIGDSIYGNDGSRYDRIGDSIYKNDGTRYDAIGDSIYGNDGSRYDRIGDSVYKNDGTRYDTVGDTVYGSDGSKATSVGDSIYVQPGY